MRREDEKQGGENKQVNGINSYKIECLTWHINADKRGTRRTWRTASSAACSAVCCMSSASDRTILFNSQVKWPSVLRGTRTNSNNMISSSLKSFQMKLSSGRLNFWNCSGSFVQSFFKVSRVERVKNFGLLNVDYVPKAFIFAVLMLQRVKNRLGGVGNNGQCISCDEKWGKLNKILAYYPDKWRINQVKFTMYKLGHAKKVVEKAVWRIKRGSIKRAALYLIGARGLSRENICDYTLDQKIMKNFT